MKGSQVYIKVFINNLSIKFHVVFLLLFLIGAKLESLGLWTHCFRSLPDPNDPAERRHFVGCHWIFDPFTKGYDEIRGFLLPCNKNN